MTKDNFLGSQERIILRQSIFLTVNSSLLTVNISVLAANISVLIVKTSTDYKFINNDCLFFVFYSPTKWSEVLRTCRVFEILFVFNFFRSDQIEIKHSALHSLHDLQRDPRGLFHPPYIPTPPSVTKSYHPPLLQKIWLEGNLLYDSPTKMIKKKYKV